MAAGGVGLQRESLFLFFAPGWLISAGGFSCSRGRIEHYIGHFAGHCSTTVGVSHAPRRWDTDVDDDVPSGGRRGSDRDTHKQSLDKTAEELAVGM